LNVEPTVFSEGVPYRVARNTVINIGSRAANIAALLVLNILVARGLGDSAYGQYVSVYALLMIFTVLANMGTETIVVRESAKDLSRVRELVSSAITLRICLAAVAYACLLVTSSVMKPDPAFVRYAAIGGLTLFVSWYVLLSAYFEATLRVGTYTIITVGSTYVTLVLTSVVLGLNGGLEAIMWIAVVAVCTTLVVAYLLVRRHFRPTLGRNLAVMKEVMSASWPLAAMAFSIIVAARIDLLMLLKMRGAAAAGYYGAATRITESFAVVPQAFMLSIFPLMSYHYARETARFGDVYKKSLKYLSVIVLPLALMLSFYSKPLLRLWGEHFTQAGPALAVLAWRLFFIYLTSVNYARIIVEGRQKIFLSVGLLLLPFAVALNLVLISRYGLIGAAAAGTLHQILAYAVLLLIPSMRQYTVALVAASWRPILAIGCAGAVMYWTQTIAGSVLALAVYMLALIALRVFDREDQDLLVKVIWKL
jgi:O-antigen/teichoic acid export membrane protein